MEDNVILPLTDRLTLGNRRELSGKKAFITGSARGIGSAIAVELARAGADITLHCVAHPDKAAEVREKILGFGVSCEIVKGDLRKPETADQLADAVSGADILVLNASVQYKKPWETITADDFYDQITCNLYSSMRLTQLAVPHMKERGWGRVVAIGSVQEAKPHPDMLVYSASKSAQTTMVRSLALQLAEFGITVNSVAPGVIATDRNSEALSDETYAKKVMSTIPVGFWGEKEDCAPMVRLLCSDAGRYITGQSIYVDGGKSL